MRRWRKGMSNKKMTSLYIKERLEREKLNYWPIQINFAMIFLSSSKLGWHHLSNPNFWKLYCRFFSKFFQRLKFGICPNTHIGLPSYAVNVTIFTKVNGATAKSVLCENLADTSWSRLVFFSRGGFPWSRGGYSWLIFAKKLSAVNCFLISASCQLVVANY